MHYIKRFIFILLLYPSGVFSETNDYIQGYFDAAGVNILHYTRIHSGKKYRTKDNFQGVRIGFGWEKEVLTDFYMGTSLYFIGAKEKSPQINSKEFDIYLIDANVMNTRYYFFPKFNMQLKIGTSKLFGDNAIYGLQNELGLGYLINKQFEITLFRKELRTAVDTESLSARAGYTDVFYYGLGMTYYLD